MKYSRETVISKSNTCTTQGPFAYQNCQCVAYHLSVLTEQSVYYNQNEKVEQRLRRPDIARNVQPIPIAFVMADLAYGMYESVYQV